MIFKVKVPRSAESGFSMSKYPLLQHFSIVSQGKSKQYIPSALNQIMWNTVLKELQFGAAYGLC